MLWHQDVLVQVKQPFDDPDYTAWSVKEGVHHVQPPVSLMQEVISLRLHLSPCFKCDGALRVLPASRTHGYHAFSGLGDFNQDGALTIECDTGGGLLFLHYCCIHHCP